MIDVYKASAGSGKTYTLVKEYLKLLLGLKQEDGSYKLNRHPDDCHSAILAITFTNKATEEMKKRIVKELDILSDPEQQSNYMDYLCSTFGEEPEPIRAAAAVALRQLLHDYTNFNVSTIDAFFQLILRTFAYEAELSGNYNVELNDDYAIAVGISDLKQKLHSTKNKSQDRILRQWLIDFMKSKIDEGHSWDIFRLPSSKGNDTTIYSFARDLSKETVKKHRDELAEYLQDKTKILRFKEELGKKLAIAKNDVKKAALHFANITQSFKEEDFNRGYGKKFSALATDDYDPKKCASITKTFDHPEKWFKKKIAESLSYETTEQINGCISEVENAAKFADSYKLVLSKLYFLGLLGDINSNVVNFSKENNLVMLSDTNEMLRKIINEEDMPFVYERTGIRLRHFLIDEFQDTSKMQWNNIVPLLSNSNSGDNDNLIIGDVKQSIYRFRNSDPYLLKDEIYKQFRGSIVDSGNNLAANTNWRSARNIVRWNNTFFSLLAANLDMSDIYNNVVQQVAEKNIDNPGHVRIEWINPGDDEEEKFKSIAYNRMVADIESMLQRGFKQKDIAILVNTNIEGQEVISTLLDYGKDKPEEERINVVSEESLLIRKSPAIKIIVGILAMLDNKNASTDIDESTDNKVNLTLLLKQFERNVSLGEMTTTEAFNHALLQSSEDIDYEYLLGAGTCAGLDAIVDRIIKTQISDSLKESQSPFIQAFQDGVAEYIDRYGSNLHRFLKWWNSYGVRTTISSPDNIQAVKVMTIHKSKGLEFPCVIIPVCNWNFDKKNTLEWVEGSLLQGFDNEILPPVLPVMRSSSSNTIFNDVFAKMHYDSTMDSLNKTYVAFTRAVEELVIYVPDEKSTGEIANQLQSIMNATEPEVNQICQEAISQCGNDVVITPNDYFNDNVFELGEPATNRKQVEEKKPKEMPAYYVNERPDTWSFDIPDIVMESRDSNRYKGVMMHKIMCRIATIDDLDKTLRSFVSKGLVTRAEAEEYGNILRKGLSNPRVEEWFSPGCRIASERPMITVDGKTYRPDRVVHTPEGKTIVIDYKFGEKDDKRYTKQVRNYMNIIADCGYSDTEGYVWYVPENTISKVK